MLGFIMGKIQNFIPWSVVWNGNSVSTSCQLVFDASHGVTNYIGGLRDWMRNGRQGYQGINIWGKAQWEFGGKGVKNNGRKN